MKLNLRLELIKFFRDLSCASVLVFFAGVVTNSTALADEPKSILNFDKLSLEAFEINHAFLESNKGLVCAAETKTSAVIPMPIQASDPSDPLLDMINAYLYFGDIAELAPANEMEGIFEYSQAFYRLLRAHKILSFQLKMTAANAPAILLSAQHPMIKVASVSDPMLKTSREIVLHHDRHFLRDDSDWSYSSSMIDMIGRLAMTEKNCGMSPAERAAIAVYVGSGYKTINRYLRLRTKAKEMHLEILAKLTDSALQHLANNTSLVFRSTTFAGQSDLPEAVYRQHSIGADVVYDAFTSTSLDGYGDSNMLIYSKTGKYLDRLGVNGEGEVLFRPHTKFRVLYNSCEINNLRVWTACKLILSEI